MKKITLLLLLSVFFGYSQAPTTDPTTPPARDAGDVISIFSGDYSNVSGCDYNPNWSQAGFGTANTNYDTGSGNVVLAYPNFNYQGVQFGTPQNIASMEFLHVDIYINGSFNPNVYVISSGGEIAHPITNTGANTWISVDIPVAGITGDLTNAIQFKFDGGNGSSDAIYVDNLYFWKAPADPSTDATLSDLQVDGVTLDGFGPATTDYTYELVIGTTTPPTTVTATTTQAGATTSITQASAVPGDATVVVTASNGTDTETYTISFVATLPNASPVPSSPDAEVPLSLYSDNPSFANTYSAEGEFGAKTIVDLDASANVDEAIKMDFATDSWGQYNNTTVDVSSAGYLNFSYFAPNIAPGPNGHEFYVMINSGSGEKFYTLKDDGTGDGAIVFGSWQNVSVPLSHFSGFDPTTFLVWKLGTPSTAFTKIVYFDNIYFSENPSAFLSVDKFNLSDVSVYPNPSENVWNIKSLSEEITSIQVYDMLGKQVLSIALNAIETKINNSQLTQGVYFAKLNTAVGSETVKLVKK